MYIGKGEEFYRKAAAEILAARDEGATLDECAESLGRSQTWVRETLKWHSSPAHPDVPTPFAGKTAEEKGRGVVEAKRVLKDAPLEQIEQIIAGLPEDRQRAVAAAAGNEYLKARQDYDEDERRQTPAQRKEREAAGEKLAQAGKEAAGGFASLSIAEHIEQAADELAEWIADGSVTSTNIKPLLAANKKWLEELHVAIAMAGLEADLLEVQS